MELTKVIENLSIKKDIGSLNGPELIEKYCKDEKSYKEFLEVFSRVFSGRKIYPILASFEYPVIESIISSGEKYSSLETEEYESSILREIYRNEHELGCDVRGDDYGQALWIFNTEIGAHKVRKDSSNFNDKISGMLECAKILDSSEGDISKDDFRFYIDSLYASEEVGRYPHRFDDFLKSYVEENPKMKLCYNNHYLYLANYLINSHSYCCDQEFLDFTKQVIKISTEVVDDAVIPSQFSKADYSRLAKFTLQNIDKLEKSRNFEKPKNKVLNFLKKRPN